MTELLHLAVAVSLALAIPFAGAVLGLRMARRGSLRRGQAIFLVWTAGAFALLYASYVEGTSGRVAIEVLPAAWILLFVYALVTDAVLVRWMIFSRFVRRIRDRREHRRTGPPSSGTAPEGERPRGGRNSSVAVQRPGPGGR